MTQLETLIQTLCPNGVKFVKLGEVVAYEQPSKYIVKSTEYDDSYDIPVLTAGQSFILGYTNEKEGIYHASPSCPVVIFDDFTTSMQWVDFPFKVKSSAMKILTSRDNETALIRYLYFALKTIKYTPDTATHARQWIGTYAELQIPLPPLAVQSEIVRVLDKFTLHKAELAAELAARLRQYEYYRDKLLTFDDTVKRVTTNEIFDVITDYTAAGSFADLAKNVKYEKEHGFAQLIRTTDLKSKFAKKDSFIYVNEHAYEYLWRVQLDKESIIMPNVGNCGEVYYTLPNIFPSEFNVLGPNAILIRSNKYLNKYLYYAIQHEDFQKQLKKITSPVGQTKFNKTEFKELLIPLPSLSEQERIVSILDRFDKLCHDIREGLPAEIELRQKQYEHYRDRLLTFRQLGD